MEYLIPLFWHGVDVQITIISIECVGFGNELLELYYDVRQRISPHQFIPMHPMDDIQ